MKFRYELHKQSPDGEWIPMWRFNTVEELNASLTDLLRDGPQGAYRGICYDKDMKVGWKEFRKCSPSQAADNSP